MRFSRFTLVTIAIATSILLVALPPIASLPVITPFVLAQEEESPGGGLSGDEVVALVSGHPITRHDLRLRIARRHFGTAAGDEARSQTLEKYLVRREMASRGIKVTEADLDGRLKALDNEVVLQSKGQSTLEAEFAKSRITLASFRSQLRFLVGLETMARNDFEMETGQPVPKVKLNLWLQDLRDSAEVEPVPIDESNPEEDGPFLLVDGHPLALSDLGSELESNLPVETLLRDLRALAGCRLIQETLRSMGLEVTKDDIDSEIARRRAALASKSGMETVSYEDILQQTRGMTLNSLVRDEEFRSQVGLRRIIDARYGQKDLEEFYSNQADRLGRSVRVRHLLVRASNAKDRYKTSVLSPEDALEKIGAIKQSMDENATLSFTELIAEHSDDKRNAGGNLGPFHRSNPLGPDFFDCAWALERGEISRPLHTRLGYHLIQLVEKKEASPLEEIESEVRSEFTKDVYRRLWEESAVEILNPRESPEPSRESPREEQ